MTNTVTIPVNTECEYHDCAATPAFAFIVTGDYGNDGIAVYCDEHSENWADPQNTHTALSTV